MEVLIMSKKTITELEQAAIKAEQRAKALREQARKQTQAEEAKQNAEIIKAIEYWNSTRQVPLAKNDIASKFYEWAEKNIGKYAHE